MLWSTCPGCFMRVQPSHCYRAHTLLCYMYGVHLCRAMKHIPWWLCNSCSVSYGVHFCCNMEHIPFLFYKGLYMGYILTVIRNTHPFCFVRVCMGYIPFLFCKGTLHNDMEHISKQICLGYTLPGQSLACTCAPGPSLPVPHQVQTWSLGDLQICTH